MEWISVEDSLPEEGRTVIVWVGEEWQDVEAAQRTKYGWDTGSDLAKYREITHWHYPLAAPTNNT